MLGDEHVLDAHAVRPARPHAEHLVATPVVEDRVVPLRHHGVAVHRRLSGPANQRTTDEMRRVGNAGAVIPLPREPVAAIDRRQRAQRRCTMRRDEMPIAEQLDLRPFAPVRRHLERM
jgi:hypothetical protein